MDGWIKLHRKITEHMFWKERRVFSRLEAWQDILLSANYKDNSEIIRGQVVEFFRGEWHISEVKLCSRWGWSRNRVRAYLNLLAEQDMITKKGTADGTVLTVVNYDFYQGDDTANETPDDTADRTPNDTAQGTAQGTQTKKERKKRKKENNILLKGELCTGLSDELIKVIENFILMRQAIKKPMTENAIALMLKKLNGLAGTDEGKIAILEQSIINGWQGIFPLKQDAQPKPSPQPWKPRKPVYKFKSDCKYCGGSGEWKYKLEGEDEMRTGRCPCGTLVE